MIDQHSFAHHHADVLSRIELLRRVEEVATSKAEIARVLNLAPPRITEIYSGKRDISFDEARKLITHYRINSDGKPEITNLADHGILMVEEIDLSLGLGSAFLSDHVESRGYVPFREDWLRDLFHGPLDKIKVVRGKGDSMRPTILDGDVILVDLSRRSLDEQDVLWAISYGDLGMIKRVRQTGRGSYMLMSDNAIVSPIEAVDDEMAIMGRVIWIGRRM